MITQDYVRTMATYNRWQNSNLVASANQLTDADRSKDMGSFFGSIINTCNHVLWGDTLWLSRFNDSAPPTQDSIPQSINESPGWNEYCERRTSLDNTICDWALNLEPTSLTSTLTFYSGAAGREITKPMALLVTHFFNHQTHHRGQVHAMLTTLGATTSDTDMPLMPD